ncbi:hypothetical protein BBW65_03510 [Helicobacter enhydrae]|uniref:Uncharacterized protein n=1 Tax=Helicobacter enhydrae TaxID=222136 RepID=A0A1B1U578_9HELI|nr:hypothetical protein BBW65_03510 [Helicobacter enhydrae]
MEARLGGDSPASPCKFIPHHATSQQTRIKLKYCTLSLGCHTKSGQGVWGILRGIRGVPRNKPPCPPYREKAKWELATKKCALAKVISIKELDYIGIL